MRVKTAGKLGYCFGVSQAIEKAVSYAEGGKVYTLGTLAHNEDVVEYLRQRGVEPIRVEDIEPETRVAITAHGAPPQLYELIKKFRCEVLDCTCPIVRKAQAVVSQQLDGFDILIFGDPNHQEVKGLVGWAENKVKFVGTFDQLFTAEQDFKELGLGKKVAVISQTTKVLSDFAEFITTLTYRNMGRFEELRVINTICPIVAARVNETRKLAEDVDMMFVVGSQESANTRNLEVVCRQAITRAKGMVEPWAVTLVQNVDQVGEALSDWFVENDMAFPRVGVTGGTSTPIEVVQEVVTKLKDMLYERENSN